MHKLYGNHLETDTRVMFHVNHADKNGNGNIIVRGNDTDRAKIIACDANLLTNSHLWYGFGVDHNIGQEFLQMFDLCGSPTGCLCIYRKRLSFYRKDKARPITVMNKHENFVNSFMALGNLSPTY